MIIFPAIDLRNGNAVRLTQGDYNKETVYSNSPEEVAKEWASKGAKYLHMVDLDGAKTGVSKNETFIETIAKQASIPVQVGGGIRSLEVVDKYLSAGVARTIIGTAAITDPDFLKAAIEKHAGKIAVSIDARNGYVATDGWTKDSTTKAIDLVRELEQLGLKTIVYTDILKDGMLKGPNFEELETINKATSMDVIASGGISSKEDIVKLQSMNMYGAIVGKALYDGRLELEELLEV